MTEPSSITADSLLAGRVSLMQPTDGYRAAVDPVLLAAAVPATAGQSVLEPGIGTGAAALCLAARVPGLSIVGLERQPEAAALARRNVAANGRTAEIPVLDGDLTAPPPSLRPGGFDHVMMNPPFAEGGTPPSHPAKAAAHMEGDADLAAWIAFALTMLRHKGTLTLIHRADRLPAICALLDRRFGEIAILPLWPKAGVPAKRVIVRARKGIKAPSLLPPGLILHEADGGYTAQAQAVLRDMAPIP